MSKLERHNRSIKVPGISEENAIKRFEYALRSKFKSERREDKGSYVVYHGRVTVEDDRNVDVIVYTSGKIVISGSPHISLDAFNGIATNVGQLAQQSLKKLEQTRPITCQRARSILNFALELDPDNEYARMVIVILADTSNEIVLTEKMRDLKMKGSVLNEGIPDKIRHLKKKTEIVYKEQGILNIREFRNGIVHSGNIPARQQAVDAIEIAKDVLENA